MAGSTIARRPRETAIKVALIARHVHVRSRQRKCGERVVIESRGSPIRRVMADCAVLWKASLNVVRVLRSCEIFQMATRAGRTRDIEIPIQMTSRAIQRGVHAGQHKAREFGVIKICPQPTVHGVTSLTGGRESRALVVREFRLSEGLRVAGDAIGGEALELTCARALVAVIAGERCVGSHQRKPVLMCAEGLKALLPSPDGVATLAIRSELAPMNVGMAVRALGADVRKHQLHVAFGAGDALVQAAQRIASLVVVKLNDVS